MANLWERLKGAFLADAPSDQTLQQLETNMSFFEGLRRLRRHKFHKRDLQYVVMLPILLYCFIVCKEPPAVARIILAIALVYLCIVPAFSQFFLNFMPTGTYLLLFYVCRFIPASQRPPIYVRVLPGLETIFYGGDLSDTLAASPNVFFDILAWLPYGLAHFGAPFVVSIILFLFGPPTYLATFHFTFGYMNVVGVGTQILFPNAPPWYRRLYGLAKADYSMHGCAGGLERIDKLLGTKLYTTGFEGSPMVFGAFPSLHSADAVMEALFMSYLFPRFTPCFILYVMWIWWSTMYLTHHYFVDLVGGGILSLVAFSLCRITILPQCDYRKFGRWSYSKVKYGLPSEYKHGSQSSVDHGGYSIYDEEAQVDPVAEEGIELDSR